MDLPIEGGCLCGAVRYRITKPPRRAGYCHCRMCQKASGAPVVAFVSLPDGGFAITKGDPAEYRSSKNGLRGFCPRCGSQLTFVDPEASRGVAVNTVTLDDPNAAPPDHHLWTSSQLSWLNLADDHTRYPENG